MIVERWDLEKHGSMLKTVLNLRHMEEFFVETVPYLGAVAIQDNSPVALFFLRVIEGAELGMFDCIISNPTFSPELRNEGLDLVTIELLKLASENRMSNLIAYTSDESTIERLCRHGFTLTPHTILYKEHSCLG